MSIISPENRHLKFKIFEKIFIYFFPNINRKLRNKIGLFLNRKNKDVRELNYNWRNINYNRIAAVNFILNNISAKRYLEIGCASNNLFDSVSLVSKTGVDPVSGGTLRMTSDDFFLKNNCNFDLIFIDGLHEIKQVYKDFKNSLEICSIGGYVCLHDMLPLNWIQANVPSFSDGPWTGDVWKMAFVLQKISGIKFVILKVDHGVGVVRKLRNDIEIPELSDELLIANFSFFVEKINYLPLVDWESFVQKFNDS